MALFFLEKTMKVSPFEVDAVPGEQPAAPTGEPQASTVMAAGRDNEDDARDREATIEEPGYGHGV
jgi:hypothetical protein